jgi:hypothetical protein
LPLRTPNDRREPTGAIEEPAAGDAHGEPVVLWPMDSAELP